MSAENNEEESGGDEEIDIKLAGEENAANETNKNVFEKKELLMYPFLFQMVLDLKKNVFYQQFSKNLPVKSKYLGKFSR